MPGERWTRQARERFASRAAAGDWATVAAEADVSVQTVGEWVRKFGPQTERRPVHAVPVTPGSAGLTSLPSGLGAAEAADAQCRSAAALCAERIWEDYRNSRACGDDMKSAAEHKSNWDRLRDTVDDNDMVLRWRTDEAYGLIMERADEVSVRLAGNTTLPPCPEAVGLPDWDSQMHEHVAKRLRDCFMDELCRQH